MVEGMDRGQLLFTVRLEELFNFSNFLKLLFIVNLEEQFYLINLKKYI